MLENQDQKGLHMNNQNWILFHFIFKGVQPLEELDYRKIALLINIDEIDYMFYKEKDVQEIIRNLLKNAGWEHDFIDIIGVEEIEVLEETEVQQSKE